MPIYEYHCADCGSEFEKFLRSMFSREAIVCPTCGSEHVAKGFSVFGTAGSSGGAARSAADCGPVG
jgi:putative FmdB family regulatory protein